MKFDRRFRACLLNLIAVVAIYFTFTLLINSGALNRYYRNILFSICINIIMAVSLNLTTGMLGELALGHAGFMAVGAFASAVITKSWAVSTAISFPVALIVGGLIAAVFGLVIGIPALRIISVSFCFAGVAIVFSSVFQALGDGMLSLVMSAVRQLLLLLPCAFVLAKLGGLDAVWFSFLIAEVASVTLAVVFYRSLYNKKIRHI